MRAWRWLRHLFGGDSETEILGAFDGFTAGTGILLATSPLGTHAILYAFKGLIISETIGMAAGKYLSLSEGSLRDKLQPTIVMAIAAFVGCVWLVVPYLLFSQHMAAVVAVCLWLMGGVLIGALRRGRNARTFVETFVILLLVVVCII